MERCGSARALEAAFISGSFRQVMSFKDRSLHVTRPLLRAARHPLHCIVPPHMLKEIVERGDTAQKEWALETLAVSARIRGNREILGELLGLFPSAGDEKVRTVYDARGGEALPGVRVRGEGDPSSKDEAVNEAYDGAGVTYDLYRKRFKRNSIDDRGMRLDSTVHYGENFDNAFWNGKQMVYGDGDGQLFNRFTIAIDVIGHELTHGVTQFSSGLAYQGQSGALNESISDVFGSLVKQYQARETARRADWLIGAGLLAKGVKGVALRSLKAPGTAYDDPVLGTDPQPAHMKDFVKTKSDNGGVHINSGIPNHAFYLLAVALGGSAWTRAGQIWYRALQQFKPATNFQSAAAITAETARGLYGGKSREEKAVIAAWKEVGIEI
jgi:Zn-dependent metalloprotease